jgi:bifunctional non-homologous end joining protein LigD
MPFAENMVLDTKDLDILPDVSRVPLRAHWRYQDAKSNKDYVTELKQIDIDADLWIATCAFGTHGLTLQTDTKMKAGPGTYEEAKKEYDSMVEECLAKGYRPEGEGLAYVVAGSLGHTHAGFHLQLLNSVEGKDVEVILEDALWVVQEKYNGKRMAIRKQGDVVEGINRLGLLCGFPLAIEEYLRPIQHDFILDGEAVGEHLFAFDILELDGEDLRNLTYVVRLERLRQVVPDMIGSVSVVETAFASEDKEALLDRVRAMQGEGVVFKRLDAPYVAGRLSGGGGTQFKFKFYSTCFAIVLKHNEQRSIGLELLGPNANGRMVPIFVGNCNIPPDQDMPSVGSIVEIRYLFANDEGCLEQPVYIGERNDIPVEECITGQLKYKVVE